MNTLPNNQASIEADIAIVTASYDNLHEDYLSSLNEALKRTSKRVEVVVVDNASPTQQTKELIDRLLPQTRFIPRDQNHGMGRSTNFGAQHVNATYYFILNPDTRLTDLDILDKLVAYADSHPDVGIIAPKIFNFDGTRQDTCRRFPTWYQPLVQRTFLGRTRWGRRYAERFLMHDFDQQTERPVEWVQGSAMLIPKQMWEHLEGFDDRFWLYFEDIDLCRRTWEAGKKVMYVPHFTLQHAFGRASARIKNPFVNFVKTKATRAHVASWLKYLWKWRFEDHPAVG